MSQLDDQLRQAMMNSLARQQQVMNGQRMSLGGPPQQFMPPNPYGQQAGLPFNDGDIVTAPDGRDGRVEQIGSRGVIIKWLDNGAIDQFPHNVAKQAFTKKDPSDMDTDTMPATASQAQAKVTFDSVILEEGKKAQILAAVKQVEYDTLIFKTWGFAEVFEKGTAISLLFYGPPGTGKTLMAQAIADHYGYKLQLVDTAAIESSEPGGAERAIKSFFQHANKKTVLLFDECDSLIGDRNEVGMILAGQINALLTALEQFKGIAIFTTNRLGRLDEAFERRLSLKLEFDLPDREHRAKIWERMFPAKAPVEEGVDWLEMAEFEIAGGHIKNTVLRAARIAADQDMPDAEKKITRDILFIALEQEMDSMRDYHNAIENTKRLPSLRGGGGLSRSGAGLSIDRTIDKVKEMGTDKVIQPAQTNKARKEAKRGSI
jgi:SpoVK/Ycf46/Vps4 family AAA+-type ATPase